MHPVTTATTAPRCSIAAHAMVEAGLTRIEELRERPGPGEGPELPRRFLRHCDEHTVVGMAAVLEAIARWPGPPPSFDRWGVLAAPCLAGRLQSALTLSQLSTAGAIGVSPHIIPQCSLHAMASAVSVGLGMHGPNIGVGGGPQAIVEGLVTSLSMLGEPEVPGLWLVLTQWDREPVPDGAGGATAEAVCRSLALALVSCGDAADLPGRATLALRLPAGRHADEHAADEPTSADQEPLTLREFAAAVTAATRPSARGRWSRACDWGARLEVA
ncbi:MAG: hypothetical protein EBZ59_04870 [Planctomycetia bacterium]|nr:hypothetical protein [Planctomycetia bacterium]